MKNAGLEFVVRRESAPSSVHEMPSMSDNISRPDDKRSNYNIEMSFNSSGDDADVFEKNGKEKPSEESMHSFERVEKHGKA